MIIKGLIFDINGTLSDIHTSENHDETYLTMSNMLSYQGILMDPATLKGNYFRIMKEQREASGEHHPEFDVVGIFKKILQDYATDFTRRFSAEKLQQLPLILGETYRAASRFRLQLYTGVKETLDELREKFPMGIVSDGQSAWALPELHAVGLLDYFNPVIVSGDFGYRKPDKRLFEKALEAMSLDASEVLFVGNDMFHDIHGAQKLSMKTVFFKTNQGKKEMDGVNPDYIIYNFPELLNAIRFFQEN